MATLKDIRQKFPQFASYNDADLASAVWNTHYAEKLPFEEFSRRIGFTPGQIPGAQPPAMPKPEEANTQPPGFFEKLPSRIGQNIQAVPLIGGAAGGLAALSRLPGTSKLGQFMGQAASTLVPKTGKELAKQTAVGAGLAPVGLLGEQAAENLGEVLPIKSLREGQKPLAEALKTPFGMGAEMLASRGLSVPVSAAQRKLAERPSAIPQERLAAARSLPEGTVPSGQLLRGSEMSQFMAHYNQLYNKLVGNPVSTDFGRQQFQQAASRFGSEYERILGGEKVTFDKSFFDKIKSLLDKQRSFAETGVMFAEARPIINTLSQISSLPKNVQARINSLRDIPETTTDIGVTRQALTVIDDAMKYLSNQKITMDAKVYNELRSQLGDAAYRTSDPARAKILRDMQSAFDSAADASLPKAKVPELKELRNQYENFSILKEAQKGKEPGMILPQNIGAVTSRRDLEGSIYGDKQMYDIGRQGMSLGMTPSGASKDLDVMDILPTQIGGVRQKVGIMERGIKGITDPLKASQMMKGPRTSDDVARQQRLQDVRAVETGIEREREKPQIEMLKE